MDDDIVFTLWKHKEVHIMRTALCNEQCEIV